VWNQIKADALQMPLVQIENRGGAAAGVAMLAGVGAGIFRSARRGGTLGAVGSPRLPSRPSRAAYYQKRAVRYELLLQSLNNWSTLQSFPP
jgi:sugar (pentulose or hexulose) kinase